MNDQQQKKYVAGIFSRAASDFDQVGFRFFSYFGKKLVEFIKISENATVLDLATGRGALLFPASEKVGLGGSVIGIDLAEGMVKKTGNVIKEKGMLNAKVVQMDAESLTYKKDTFDYVLCGLSIFFFPKCEIALREAYRVLKHKGKIGISTFDPKSSEELKWVRPIFQKYTPEVEEKRSEGPEFGSPEGMQKMLIKEGFKNISHKKEEKMFECKNVDELWAFFWSVYTRESLEKITPSKLPKFKEELRRGYTKYSDEETFSITVKVLFTIGEK